MNTHGRHRIAFCITELEPGGAERCLVELVTRLDRHRFDPVVYCLGPRPAGNPASLADALACSGTTVHCFDARGSHDALRVLRMLLRRLLVDRPEIVQGFLFHANVLSAVAGRWAKVPHVVSGIRVAERRRWHLALARWTDRWVARHACVSLAVRDHSIRAGLPPQKLLVIPNGVDCERFAGAAACDLSSLAVAPGRGAITFIGRLDEQKGLAWLLELAPDLFKQLPDHDLLLVGTGPQRGSLEKRARDLGLASRVHFAGFRTDIPAILAASDMLVLPSRWEGMPNVVLEAMAAGRPVVATGAEGVTEALGPGFERQTVPLGDSEGFVNQVISILRNPILAGQLGEQNRQRAREHFSLSAMVRAYEQLYSSLLSGGR